MSASTMPADHAHADLYRSLERARANLVASVASGGDLDAPTVGTIGETEHLAEESQRGVDILIAALHRTSLQEVEDALARFERGEFGRCVACGCDIPIERLEAMPAAANCVHCQGALERSH